MIKLWPFMILVLLLFTGLNVFSQNVEVENKLQVLRKVSFSEPSYVTLREGIGNLDRLTYEGSVVPDLHVVSRRFSNWGLELTPQITFRMLEIFSHPIRTPSYNPRGTLFYLTPEKEERNYHMLSFLTLGHHSNGQDGEFYNPDSTLNQINGSFSTNYGTTGLLWINKNEKPFTLLSKAQVSFTYYSIFQPVLRALYGKTRYHVELESVIHLTDKRWDLLQNKQSESKIVSNMQLGWIGSELMDAKAFDSKRMIIKWTVSWQPAFVQQLSFFSRFYYGQDYYNIQFDRTLKVLHVGVMFHGFSF